MTEARLTLDEAEETIFARIAAAEIVGEIVKDYGIHRSTFYRWIQAGGEERLAKFRAAQLASGDGHAEMAVTILDEAKDCENSHQATIAKARSDVRKWLAERLNRTTYGESKADVNVNVMSMGTLHLDALRAKGSMAKPAPTPLIGVPVNPIPDGEGE